MAKKKTLKELKDIIDSYRKCLIEYEEKKMYVDVLFHRNILDKLSNIFSELQQEKRTSKKTYRTYRKVKSNEIPDLSELRKENIVIDAILWKATEFVDTWLILYKRKEVE